MPFATPEVTLSRTLKFAVRRLETRALAAMCAVLFGIAPALAQSEAEEETDDTPRVFSSHEPVEFTLRADMRELLRDRDREQNYHPGMVRVPRLDGGGMDSVPVQVRTRGIFRRRPSTCSFPPLRMTFERRATRGTALQGERRFKIVTHCRSSGLYEQYVLQEYLIYRAFSMLSPFSLRTRLARITYEDTRGREETVTRYAILIEHEEQLAERHGMRVVSDTGVSMGLLDPRHTVFMAVFQYFIGNTDWSVRALHNVILLADSVNRHVPVPYDFDWSGVIATRYAKPDTSLPIKRVEERVYAGYCGHPEDFEPIFQQFRDKRAELEALYDLPGLDREHRDRARRYYADFYKLIDDKARVRRDMLRLCP
jgi:hypothetical protein